MTTLAGLLTAVQAIIREAFWTAVPWSFVSFAPLLGVGCILSVFLSKIPDTNSDRQHEDKPTDAGNGSSTVGPKSKTMKKVAFSMRSAMRDCTVVTTKDAVKGYSGGLSEGTKTEPQSRVVENGAQWHTTSA
ncbi:hypothetical protein BU15DRAFT_63348 [Melanogaster broomeanus]|nr:hypothetical protein BU15DRAFT_63348 [Melanogaster broomeanus]